MYIFVNFQKGDSSLIIRIKSFVNFWFLGSHATFDLAYAFHSYCKSLKNAMVSFNRQFIITRLDIHTSAYIQTNNIINKIHKTSGISPSYSAMYDTHRSPPNRNIADPNPGKTPCCWSTPPHRCVLESRNVVVRPVEVAAMLAGHWFGEFD